MNNNNKDEKQIQEAFQSYYLRKITDEFSDELDSLRNAPDFTDATLPLLMRALKQGVEAFSLVEMRAVVEGEGELREEEEEEGENR